MYKKIYNSENSHLFITIYYILQKCTGYFAASRESHMFKKNTLALLSITDNHKIRVRA